MKKMSVLKKFAAILIAILIALSSLSLASFAAARRTGGVVAHFGGRIVHYVSAEDAWNAAIIYDSPVLLILEEDWEADKNGDLGTGRGFKDGAISISDKSNRITFNLNGYSIDRGLAQEKENGCVFLIDNCSNVTICNNTGRESVITGGNNTGNAGAIKVIGSSLNVSSVTISGNKTAEKGGAIYIATGVESANETKSTVVVDSCNLTANEAKSGGAIYLYEKNELHILDTQVTGNKAVADAGIHTEVSGLSVSTIYLGGKVIIADNISETDGTGLMLDENFFKKVYVKYNFTRPLSKDSRIVILSKTDDNTLRITDNSDDSYIECYEYENDSYKIVAKGSGESKYLDIKKN